MLFDVIDSHTLAGAIPKVWALNISPDGTMAIVGGDTDVYVIDLSDMSVEQSVSLGSNPQFYGVALSHDNSIAAACYAGDNNTETVLFDVSDGSTIGTYTLSAAPHNVLEFSPDDNYLVGGTDGGGDCHVIDPTDGSEIGTFTEHSSGIYGLAIDSNNIAYTLNYNIRAWDITDQTEQWMFDYTADTSADIYPASLDLSPDEEELFIMTDRLTSSSYVHIILDTDGNVVDDNVPLFDEYTEEQYQGVRYSPTGKYVAIYSEEAYQDFDTPFVRIIDIENKEKVGESTDFTYPTVGGFSSDSAYLITGDVTETALDKREMMPVEGTIYFEEETGLAINDNGDYLMNQLDIGTVHQTQNSNIIPVKVINNTGGELSSITISAENEGEQDLTFSETEDPFDDLQQLEFTSGPYTDGQEITFYVRLSATVESPLGEGTVTMAVQGS